MDVGKLRRNGLAVVEGRRVNASDAAFLGISVLWGLSRPGRTGDGI